MVAFVEREAVYRYFPFFPLLLKIENGPFSGNSSLGQFYIYDLSNASAQRKFNLPNNPHSFSSEELEVHHSKK